MEKSKRILAEALELSPIDRASLVEELLSSFTFSGRRINDAVWAREAEDRIDAYDSGVLESSSLEEVFKRLNRKSE
jgi:putative addiction module component (TIGR02574 family)